MSVKVIIRHEIRNIVVKHGLSPRLDFNEGGIESNGLYWILSNISMKLLDSKNLF